MFTGIIEEIGTINNIEKKEKSYILKIGAVKVLEGSKPGDSIAVNGVCLTVTKIGGGYFTADVMAETIRRSNLELLKFRSAVNLERALGLNSRLGGHIVSGHIDGTGVIGGFKEEGNAVWVSVNAGPSILKYIVEKGSIAIDGISLTVAYADEEKFKVSLIPHTGEETTLLKKKVGESVNLECDIIGKYVDKLLPCRFKQENGISENFLKENGFF